MTKDVVTVRELYTLIDQRVGEVNKSIERLENKFDALEAGRITRLETKFAEMAATHSEQARNVSLWVSIVIGVGFILLKYFLKI